MLAPNAPSSASGPYGFLEAFDPVYTPNTTDMPGRRYCYQQQPEVAQWNLVMLANALLAGGLVEQKPAEEALGEYSRALLDEYTQW